MDSKQSHVNIATRNAGKGNSGLRQHDASPKPAGRPSAPIASDYVQDELTRAQRLRLNVQRELELAKKMRAEAERYQRQTETRARSEAQRLILETRLSIKREISELKSGSSEQIKKILVDLSMTRLAAQEELEAQRQFTRAAKISALSSAFEDETKQTSEA